MLPDLIGVRPWALLENYFDQRHSVGADGFAAAHSPEAFACLRFNAHLCRPNAQCRSHPSAHTRDVGSEFRTLEPDRRIDI